MEVATTQPGVQLYTPEFLEPTTISIVSWIIGALSRLRIERYDGRRRYAS